MDLWYVRTNQVSGDDLLAACDALLTSSERERSRRFRFERHRHAYVVTRVLCRAVLSTYVGVMAHDLRFRRNTHGRPELELVSDLRFNLSNTESMVVCAVDVGREVGVDAEPLSRGDRILQISGDVCTRAEQERLARLEHRVRRTEAVRLWTLKEAYMKARGMGMSLPPETFQIDIEGPRCCLECVAAKDDDPARWDLSTRQIEDHVVGTCVEQRGWASSPVVRHADLRVMLNVGAA